MPQQRHIVGRVRSGAHPRYQRRHLQPGVGALVGGHRQVLPGELAETGAVAQRKDRDQPGRRHKIRIIEHRRGRSRRVAKLHLRDALRAGANWTLEKSNSPSTQGILALQHAHATMPIGESRLSPSDAVSPYLLATSHFAHRCRAEMPSATVVTYVIGVHFRVVELVAPKRKHSWIPVSAPNSPRAAAAGLYYACLCLRVSRARLSHGRKQAAGLLAHSHGLLP